MCLKSSLGLDFLSSSPNNFIFKETANKTTCGVICSLLYIIGLSNYIKSKIKNVHEIKKYIK